MYVLKFIFFVAHCWGEILRIVGLIISIKKQVSSVSYFLRVQIYEHFTVTPRKPALFLIIIFLTSLFVNFTFQNSTINNLLNAITPIFSSKNKKAEFIFHYSLYNIRIKKMANNPWNRLQNSSKIKSQRIFLKCRIIFLKSQRFFTNSLLISPK
jgi:hypothetical protein